MALNRKDGGQGAMKAPDDARGAAYEGPRDTATRSHR